MRRPETEVACQRHDSAYEWRLSMRSQSNEWLVDHGPAFKPFHDEERAAQLARLESFHNLRRGWDSYNAEPPNETSINNARHVLHVLWASEIAAPVRTIAPSVEGGVGIVFASHGKKYADIECFNDGEILAITSEEASEPLVWTLEVGSIRRAVERISSFLDG
jgi:hypothetical protein